jgi:hypothetical protein
MYRPSFINAWSRFSEVNLPIAKVGTKIGGKVGQNIASGVFQNACPIRISYVLNYCSIRIPKPKSGYAVVGGADGRWYMYRVREMMAFLEKTFGKADRSVKTPHPAEFDGIKGIIAVKGHGWSDAVGHVTLWNGTVCSDCCHLFADPENGSFIPEVASIWKLP